MKIVKVRFSGDRRRKTEVVLNSNNIAYEFSNICDLDDRDLCDKLLNIVLEDTSEIKFNRISFKEDYEDDILYHEYTLTANINYKGVNMFLDLCYTDSGEEKKGISIGLCDPIHAGYIGYAYIFQAIDDDFITQYINSANIDYYLNDEKVDKDSFNLYCALNN